MKKKHILIIIIIIIIIATYMTIKDFRAQERLGKLETINYEIQQQKPIENNSNPTMDPSYTLRDLNKINNSNSTNNVEQTMESQSPYEEYDDYYDDVRYDYYWGYDWYDDHREDYFDEFWLED